MKLPEGWSLRTGEYTTRGIRFEFELTRGARVELIDKGYQNTEISFEPEGEWVDDGAIELYDAINKMLGYDMDPLGTVQWWGKSNRFVGDVAGNTPLEALTAGTLRVDQVLQEIEWNAKGME